MIGMQGRAFRATFEDVLLNQTKLISRIDHLINENRPLDPNERLPFLQLLARSTLGLGTKISLNFDGAKEFIFEPVDSKIPVRDAEGFMRFLVFFDKQSIVCGDKAIPIGQFWLHARSLVLLTFPLALERASQMSVERIPYDRPDAEAV